MCVCFSVDSISLTILNGKYSTLITLVDTDCYDDDDDDEQLS
jgi:hypothetical protein